MVKKKPIICLDFDGVVNSYDSGWQGATTLPDPPVPGAFDFIRNALEIAEVCVYSTRSHQEGGIDAMMDWFKRNGWADEMTRGGAYPETPGLVHFPDCKPPAVVSLDDRGVRFEGVFPAPSELLRLRPWNKQKV